MVFSGGLPLAGHAMCLSSAQQAPTALMQVKTQQRGGLLSMARSDAGRMGGK
jgi:hypothetical protein